MKLTLDVHAKPQYSSEYLALHEKFGVPLHGLTSEQVRFFHYAFRNEINVFFRTCGLTGERIISQFPEESRFIVYQHEKWWTRDFPVPAHIYNPSRSIFAQFRELQLAVPRTSIAGDSTLDNSSFSNASNRCKDCYMVFGSGDCEDCHYTIDVERSLSSMDLSIVHGCELCYELVSCRTCYNLDFSAYCIDCSDSAFLYDCRRCQNCFLCVGLVGREYCIGNEQLSRDAYQHEMQKFRPLTSARIATARAQLEELRGNHIHKYANISGCEDCSGNDIAFSQRCTNSYIVEHSRDCINGTSLRKCYDCLDFDLWGDPGELCYHSMSCGYHVYNLRMCFSCWNNCSNLTYCDSCPGCEHCFACCGIKHRKFCVLNTQYTEREYFRLVDQIVESMKARGEWGQFFPPSCSPFPLNISMTNEYFHITPELAHSLGFGWREDPAERAYDQNMVYSGPSDSRETTAEEIKGKIFICAETGHPFRIHARELTLLQRKELPLPDVYWRRRMENRAGRYIFPWRMKRRQTIDTNREMYSPVVDRFQIRERDID